MKLTLLLSAVLATLVAARSPVLSYGHEDLAECSCSCPCNKVSVKSKPCDVDVIILVNAAACVKSYRKEMKNIASQMVEDIFEKHSSSSNTVRISAITYSTTVKTIVSWNNNVRSKREFDQIFKNDWKDNMQGNGDFLSRGLEAASDSFDGLNSNSKKVLMVITNSGDYHNQVEAAAIKSNAKNLRADSVEIFVHTITEYCLTPKDCLMCCPDTKFLSNYLTTTDKICSDRPDSRKFGVMQKNGQSAPRRETDFRRLTHPNQSGPFFGWSCNAQMAYTCEGEKVIDEECNKICNCSCKQERKGIAGLPGKAGKKGIKGIDGKAGQPGTPGKTGYPGMPGAPGQDGTPGKRCVDGKPAPPGRQGPHGMKARNGPPGDQGAPGAPGPNGSPGDFGAPGSPGPNGAPGALGARGPSGQPGKPGMPGKQGMPGCQGKQGEFGADGAAGRVGAPGNAGAQGQAGYKGKAGTPGKNGKVGAPGAAGAAGKAGIQGVAGIDGRQGPPGQQGLQGDQGLKGISVKFDYSRYMSLVDAEIDSYLASFGWKFNCDCSDEDDKCVRAYN
jgi:hypothetical protein